jgi:hypothetical protein
MWKTETSRGENMPFTKIVPADLQGKGVIGQPAVPGLSVTEMQESVEQIVREVAIPAVNRLVDELGATTAAGNIGAVVPDGLSAEPTVQDVVSAIHEAANSGKDEVAGDLEQHKSNTSNPHAVTAAQTGAYTKSETDAAINEKVAQIGAGDMSKAVYDPTGQQKDIFAAISESATGSMQKSDYASDTPGAVNRAISADNGISTYTCDTSGTTHALNGTGNNIKFVADAAYNEGDTITVNGTAVTAQTQDGAALVTGAWASGATVACWLNGTTLTVSGGGSSQISGYGALVDITAYTGSTGEHTAYTTPSAGWVTLIATTGSSVATIRDETYPTSGNYLASVFSSSTVGGMATVYVPKGAKIYSTVFSGSVEKMTFVPAN